MFVFLGGFYLLGRWNVRSTFSSEATASFLLLIPV